MEKEKLKELNYEPLPIFRYLVTKIGYEYSEKILQQKWKLENSDNDNNFIWKNVDIEIKEE